MGVNTLCIMILDQFTNTQCKVRDYFTWRTLLCKYRMIKIETRTIIHSIIKGKFIGRKKISLPQEHFSIVNLSPLLEVCLPKSI